MQSRVKGYPVRRNCIGEARPQQPMTNSTLNTAEPTIAAMPTSDGVGESAPTTEVKNSGAEPPAAIKVAPATSADNPSFREITSRDGTKNSSQATYNATNM
mmetsp:Transcript_120571/g.240074  ORF Transcript_120571/g.240074 Transcript_120571/m.240074 type:complete len:101 (-) Transcript_120571:262-564(-)